MPRPIIGQAGNSRAAAVGGVTPATRGAGSRLRDRRSAAVASAIQSLDASGHQADRSGLERLVDAIAAEFPEISPSDQPLGLVARCHLGPPFEVHVCDLAGMIIEHYPPSRAMPGVFERARSLALHPAYVYVEVYRSSLMAVAPDGSVSVVEA